MRRLLAVAAVAAAFAAPAVPATAAVEYDRTCGGVVDYECNGRVCPMDCFPRQCLVWLDPFHNQFTAQCVSPIGA
ncbi:MAG TPA: hypothetical protein VGX28_12045 [Frankiaceae bacterium]|jgi:hypothetical protein|nr:hypothetical protein [Frankiaceae bacterium]